MHKQGVRQVLMTGDTVGGVWTFTLDLAAALGAYDIEVTLAALGGEPDEAQRAAAAAIPNLQLHTSRYKLEWMDDPWSDVKASGEWLLGIEQKLTPDVVHLNSLAHGALPWKAPVLLTVHSCVLSWWDAVRHDALPSQWNCYRSEVERSLKMAGLLTAPSCAMLRTVIENYGPDLPASITIHNGRRPEIFRAPAKEAFILTAGRLWDEAKNIAAVAQVAPNLPWPSYVAGEDRNPNGASIELAGCRLLGRLSPDQLAGWYARASIYALPARYEPFGLSALEAAMSGCALVLGDIKSLREIWENAAIFVQPDYPDQLELALRELIVNPTHREGMASRAMARARTFTADRMASEYVDVYRSLAGSRRLACAS